MKHIVEAVVLVTWLWAALSAAAGADTPLVVELWPGKVPDETGDIGPEKVRVSPRHTRKEVEVTEPTRLVTIPRCRQQRYHQRANAARAS